MTDVSRRDRELLAGIFHPTSRIAEEILAGKNDGVEEITPSEALRAISQARIEEREAVVQEVAKAVRRLMNRGGYPPGTDEVVRAIRALSCNKIERSVL